MADAPLVSVVIAAYRPGDGFDRVMASLDAQTLPQDRFETIVVDDGSPDDTYERISALAATRPNLRVERIENSGWPSRPRNVATQLARGDYVLYMDHDDSLYPDALRRMVEYAAETKADLLSPKESKTSDAWWGMPALIDGNIPNAITDGGIDRLLPMVPHKLYRRAFLDEHGIRFPEGRRQLWEDIYVNVAAWARAEHVAVLADTPAYLWWSSATNNSKTYGPRSTEFWDRLDELFAFIESTLDGPQHADARRAMLQHQYTGRVLTRLSRNLKSASTSEAEMGMRRARAIQQRYIPEEWDGALGKQNQARAALLRRDRPDLLAALWTADSDSAARVRAVRAEWREGALHLALEAQWLDREHERVGLRRDGERLVRDLAPDLLAALPAEVVDLADTLPQFRVDLGVRDRFAHVTWELRTDGAATWEELDDGRVAPALTITAVLDPAVAAVGRPLDLVPHDFVAQLHWAAASRGCAVSYRGTARPATLGDRPAVAYRAMRGSLALDLSAELRNPVADGGPALARVPGTLAALSLPLPKIRTHGRAELRAAARLQPAEQRTGAPVVLPGVLRADADGARLDVSASGPVPGGMYELTFSVGDGPFLGKRPARVRGDSLEILPRPNSKAAKQRTWPARIGRLRARARDVGREVYRRIRR